MRLCTGHHTSVAGHQLADQSHPIYSFRSLPFFYIKGVCLQCQALFYYLKSFLYNKYIQDVQGNFVPPYKLNGQYMGPLY
jgi:hypothetical protein